MQASTSGSSGPRPRVPRPGSRSTGKDAVGYAHGLPVHPSLTSAGACLKQPGAPAPAPQTAAPTPGPTTPEANQGLSSRGRTRVRARAGGRGARASDGAQASRGPPRTRTSARIRSRAQQGKARSNAPPTTVEAQRQASQSAAAPVAESHAAAPFPMLRPPDASSAAVATTAGAYADFGDSVPLLPEQVGAGPEHVPSEWFAASPRLNPAHRPGQVCAAHDSAHTHTGALSTTPVAATQATQHGGDAAAARMAHAAPPIPPYTTPGVPLHVHTSPALGSVDWNAMSLEQLQAASLREPPDVSTRASFPVSGSAGTRPATTHV